MHQLGRHAWTTDGSHWLVGQGEPLALQAEPIDSSQQRRAPADSPSPSQSLRYWNLTSQTPVATVQLPERCYSAFSYVLAPRRRPTLTLLPLSAMDVAYPLMVVGTAERHILIFNLSESALHSPLLIRQTDLGPPQSQPHYASQVDPQSTQDADSLNRLLPRRNGLLGWLYRRKGRRAAHRRGQNGFQLLLQGKLLYSEPLERGRADSAYSSQCHRADHKGAGFKTGSQSVSAVNAISGHPLGTWATAGEIDVIASAQYITADLAFLSQVLTE